MKRFKYKKVFKRNVVVHLDTKEKYEEFLECVQNNMNVYMNICGWDRYKQDTCYHVYGGCNASLKMATELGYKIFSYEDAIKRNKVEVDLDEKTYSNGIERLEVTKEDYFFEKNNGSYLSLGLYDNNDNQFLTIFIDNNNADVKRANKILKPYKFKIVKGDIK